MPLAFHSVSHGTIAFGFFQIEIDMLLLERLFFFADDFCRAVTALAVDGQAAMDGFRIGDADKAGNLHGAIAGTDLSGFIGATYRRYPFPADPMDFKQNPDGARNREWAKELVARFGVPVSMPLRVDAASGRVSVDEVVFDAGEFVRLIAYVEQGGYPRWKDEIRPSHVREMTEALRGTPWDPT